MSTRRYFFFVDSFVAALFEVAALGWLLLPTRENSWPQNAPISSGLPSRKETNLSCREDTDLAEVASARTKSTAIGSEAPVRRMRESDTKVLLSILGTELRRELGGESLTVKGGENMVVEFKCQGAWCADERSPL